MTELDFIMFKREIYDYSGIQPTDEEAWEIYDIMRSTPYANLRVIVVDYYYGY